VTGLIHSKVAWTGPNGQSLLCIDTSFKVANAWNPFGILEGLFDKGTQTKPTKYLRNAEEGERACKDAE
jgi:hypothetical protein